MISNFLISKLFVSFFMAKITIRFGNMGMHQAKEKRIKPKFLCVLYFFTSIFSTFVLQIDFSL